MLLEVIPTDKKKYLESLTQNGFIFTTKPQSKKVVVEIDIDDVENVELLEKFYSIDEKL